MEAIDSPPRRHRDCAAMASTDAALWQQRFLRFALGGGAPVLGGVLGALRNKWLAYHLEASGLGVLAQVISGQNWLGTMTGLGLGLPVARAVGGATAAGDASAVRRATWTALGLMTPCLIGVVAIGLLLAPWLSRALLGSDAHATLVRISMLGVAGLALQTLALGLFAGHSDVRAPLTLAMAGGIASLAVIVALVPRAGLAGGALGAAVLFPAGVAASLWVHRRRYAAAWAPRSGSDARTARSFLKVAAAA